MKMTTQALLDAGYKQFADSIDAQRMGAWYRATYQKRITDPYGVRYFITVGHSVMPPRPQLGIFDTPDMFSPGNQFKQNGIVFNVSMLWHDESLDQMEAFFANLWDRLRLDYYEEYSYVEV